MGNTQSSKRFKRDYSPEEELIRIRLNENFERLKLYELYPPPAESQLYCMQDKFAIPDQYWLKEVWIERFRDSQRTVILDRPAIVSELIGEVEKVLNDDKGQGIMIKGPQGIGKSHSIVNLVRKLLYGSGGKYLVTFIPDCRRWKDVEELYTAICQSLGSTTKELNIEMSGSDSENNATLKRLIEIIAEILLEQGRQWIFIFDQVNAIFSRWKGREKINQLPFPFYFIEDVMDNNRITTIISASANNEMYYSESHDGFVEYNHRFYFNEQELSLLNPLYDTYEDEVKVTLMKKTGGVPLQVHTLVSRHSAPNGTFAFENYEDETIESICYAFHKLSQERSDFSMIRIEACNCLFSQLAEQTFVYDRKYSFNDNGNLKPVFPLVLDAYQKYFWKEIMDYVETSVSEILVVCNDRDITCDVRGRLFGLLIIRRCQGRSLRMNNLNGENDADIAHFPGFSSCILAKRFPGRTLPTLADDGLYVPVNPNFPAVDLIWKMQGNIWFVQVHVTTHVVDVSKTLKPMIESALKEGCMNPMNLFHST